MENLTLEKFNPKKAELIELVSGYKNLNIADLDDKAGYVIVDNARKELKKQRVVIEKQGKELRADAVKFQKDVIAFEKDLIGIIEPLEKELQAKQDFFDSENTKKNLSILLPSRKARLAEINVEVQDEVLLELDVDQFEFFFNDRKTEYLNKKEAELNAEKNKIEQEKIDKENEALRLKQQEEKRLAELKKYQKFLKDNNYNELDFHLIDKGNMVVMYKKVAEFIK